MIKKLQISFYYLSLFSFILQTGKHFWPQYSYISGARIDYLSPTLHFSDITIAALFIMVVIANVNNLLALIRTIPLLWYVIMVLVVISALVAEIPEAAGYGVLKVVECSFFAWYTAQFISKKTFPFALDMLVWAALLVSGISFAQFFWQKSLGGIFYFLGERTFSLSSGNVALVYENGHMLLRPYATFPHPNVLAYFLLIVCVLILFSLMNGHRRYERIFLIVSYVVISAALFISFSRIIILAYGMTNVALFSYAYYKTRLKILLVGLLFIGISFVMVSFRFSDGVYLQRDWLWRQELIGITAQIIKSHLWIGTGINNTFMAQAAFQKIYSPTYLQPVHNIYLHILAQTGIVALICILIFLIKTVNRLFNLIRVQVGESRQFYVCTSTLFCMAIIVGLFDHYPITLQQGQLITSFILGLCWATWKRDTAN